MTRTELLEELREVNPEARLADGFEEAFVGICRRFGQEPLAAYNYEKCIEIMVERDGMTVEEAVEFFDFNVIGSWVGDGTPVFVTLGTTRFEEGVITLDQSGVVTGTA